MVQKPKVLFIIPSVSPGGIETYLLRFLKAKGKEVEAVVLVRSQTRGKLFAEYEALGIPLVFMPLGYLNPFRWFRYYRFFRKNRFDTVCDFNANFAGIPLWLAKLAGIKNRIAFYRQGKDHFKPGIIKNAYNTWMNRLVYRNASKILANSQAGIEYFFPKRRAEDSRFKVINNGIEIGQYKKKINKTELRFSLGIPQHAFVIGHTGRFDKSKNHKTILMVAEKLIKEDPDVFLVLIGPAPKDLEGPIQTLGISDNVRVLGYRPDVPELLQIFDVFYFPSITEGQPNALIEAMAAGIPVIASNITPIKEIFPVRTRSLLIDPHDFKSACLIISKLKKNPKTSNEYVFQALAIEKFNGEINFKSFLNLL